MEEHGVVPEGDGEEVSYSIDAAVQNAVFNESSMRRAGASHVPEVCKFWLQGKCRKDTKCEFLHLYELPLMPECRNGRSCGTRDCPFRHTGVDASLEPPALCLRFLDGYCPEGDRCGYLHVQLPPHERPLVSPRLYRSAEEISVLSQATQGAAANALRGRSRGTAHFAADRMRAGVEWFWLPIHPANRPRLRHARLLRLQPNDGRHEDEEGGDGDVEVGKKRSRGGGDEGDGKEARSTTKKKKVDDQGKTRASVATARKTPLPRLLERYIAACQDPKGAGFLLPDSAVALNTIKDGELRMVGAISEAVKLVPARYFVVKVPNEAMLRTCARRNAWGVERDIATKINHALRSCRAIFLFFSVVNSKGFQGVARLPYGAHDLRREPCLIRLKWLRLCTLPFARTNMLVNPAGGMERVARSWNWQELPPALGRVMMLLSYEATQVQVALEVPDPPKTAGPPLASTSASIPSSHPSSSSSATASSAAATSYGDDLVTAPGMEHDDGGWVGGGGVLGSATSFRLPTAREMLCEDFGDGLGPDEEAVEGVTWAGFTPEVLELVERASGVMPKAAIDATSAGLGPSAAAAVASGVELTPAMVAEGMLQQMAEKGVWRLGSNYGPPLEEAKRFSRQYRGISAAAVLAASWAAQPALLLPISSSVIDTVTEAGIAPVLPRIRPADGITKGSPILLLNEADKHVIGLFVAVTADTPPPRGLPPFGSPTVVGLVCAASCPPTPIATIDPTMKPGVIPVVQARAAAMKLIALAKAPPDVLGGFATLARGLLSKPPAMERAEQEALRQEAQAQGWLQS